MLHTRDPLSHPLNHRLLGWWRCWPGLTGGIGVCDIALKNNAEFNGPRGDFWMKNGKVEFGRLCWAAIAGSTPRFDLDATRRYQNLPAFTIAVTVYGRGGPTGGDATTGFFGAWDGVHSTNQVLMRVSGGIQCFIRDAANTAQAAPTVTSPSSNEWHRYVIRGDGSTLSLSYDGLATEATASLAGPYIPTATETWSFGCARGSQEFTRSSDLKIWGRCLTDREVVEDWHDTEQLHPPSAYRRQRWWGAVLGGGTSTATAALTAGGATLAASATHTAPTYTASTALTAGGATLASSATFVVSTFTASTALTAGGATLVAAATHTTPTYTASTTLTAGGASLAASATFAGNTYTASAALTAGGGTLAASATHTAPTYTASAALTAGGATLAASAQFAASIHTASTVLTAGGGTLSASATFAAGTKTATAALTAGGATLAATATHTTPTYTATVALAAGGGVLAATAPAIGAVVTGSPTLEWAPSEDRLHWTDTDTRLHWG